MRPEPILVLALAFGSASASEASVTVSDYCASFARVYAEREGAALVEGSVQAIGVDWHLWRTVTHWLQRAAANFFQPSGSKFVAGYRCRFETDAGEFSVRMYLTETLEFAEYTQWPNLQLVPIQYVSDDASGLAGYGVFKYLRPANSVSENSGSGLGLGILEPTASGQDLVPGARRRAPARGLLLVPCRHQHLARAV